jgi:transposase InsO family protein
MGSTATKPAAPQALWIPLADVMDCSNDSRRTVYRRMNDEKDLEHLVWKNREDGKPGRVIYRPSMNDDEKHRWLKKEFLRDSKLNSAPDSTPAASAGEHPSQGRLWPDTEVDRQLAELQAQCGEEYTAMANQRYQAILPLLNHEWMVRGKRSMTALAGERGKLLGVSGRTVLRLREQYLERELIADLARNPPGPEKGRGSILDADDRAYIRDQWEEKLSTRAGTTRNWTGWKKKKQAICGGRYAYSVLGEDTPARSMAVERFIKSIGGDDNPRRRRGLGLIERVGFIDRTFEDEFSADTWCIDEWELDGAFFNPRRHNEIFWGDSGRKPYLISVIDERSTYLLGARLTLNLSADAVLELLEALVRAYGPPLRLVSDRGGHFRKGVGGRIMVRQRGELVERCMGAMANFGVTHKQPRRKNPRGNRIERALHGIYSGLARRDFGPSWKGANVEQRKLTEIDERVARHLKEYCKQGTCGPQILSYDEAEHITAGWRDEINMMSGTASGLLGLTRQAAWRQFQRREAELAARRPTEDQIRQAFAEHYKDETIEPGGTVTLPDGLRYYHPLLGEPEYARHTRDVVRYRDDHSFIIVIARQKGEENIRVPRKVRVGVNDPDQLASAMELQNRLRKLVGETTKPMDYDPGSPLLAANSNAEAPKASQVIQPSEFMAAQDAPEPEPPDFPEISSMEWQSEGKGPHPEPWDFADLES